MSRKRQETINCDAPGCQQVKGDSNHWFTVYHNGVGEVVIAIMDDDINATVIASDIIKDFCGEACLIKGLPAFIRRLNGT